MRALFKEKGSQFRVDIVADPAVQDFISTHASALDSSFEKEEMSDAMRRRLTRSNYIFSSMKAFHELHEAFPSLIDENGDRKSFERFLSDVRKIDATYNANYLRVEYNFVAASANMAARWEAFALDGDRYNLQYRTQRDDKVRPDHAALDRITLPIDDSFWEDFYPPNGWNCRCSCVQVLKSKYPVTDHDEAMQRGNEAIQRDPRGIFRFNPGIERKSVPDYNPYTIRRCRDCDIAKGKTKLARFIPDNEVCRACIIIRKMVDEEQAHGISPVDKKAVKAAAKEWAERHIPIVSDHGGQPAQRMVLHNETTGLDFILNKKFFGETFSNCVRADNTAETMALAVRIDEWLPKAIEVGIEPGRDHAFDFKVMKVNFEDREIIFKAKMIGKELILYTMRVYKQKTTKCHQVGKSLYLTLS